MENLWEKIKQSVKEGVAIAAEKTEGITKLGKMKLDILKTKHTISRSFAELGGIVYEGSKEGIAGDALNSAPAKKIMASLNKLEEDLNAKEKLYDEMKKTLEKKEKTGSKEPAPGKEKETTSRCHRTKKE